LHPHDGLKATDAHPFDSAQGRICAGTGFTKPLQQGLSLLLSFIPNQPLSRQGKSFEAISKIFLSLALSLLVLGPFGHVQGKLCRNVERAGFIKDLYLILNFGMVWMFFYRFDCNYNTL